jgi:hypothetical protein
MFLGHILMVDKSKMHLFDPKLKQQNGESWSTNSPQKEIVQRCLGCSDALMVMRIMSFTQQRLELLRLIPLYHHSHIYYGTLLHGKFQTLLYQKVCGIIN